MGGILWDMEDRTGRALQLLSLLQRRSRWTGPELADHLGVTTRTVRRDVDRLRALGYPIDAEPGRVGGYRLGDGGDLPPLLLDEDEATAVAVALGASAANAQLGIEPAALAALAKLHRLLPPRLRRRVEAVRQATSVLAGPAEPVDPEVLATLAACIEDDERVELAYVDRSGHASRRRLEPLRLVAVSRRWYLAAWDLDRRDWRTFRVDRIDSARATGHRFRPGDRPDPVDLVRRAITVAPYDLEIVVRFDAPADDLARRIPPSVGTITADGDRSQLHTGGDDPMRVLAHLVAMDIPFEILEPDALRKQAAGLAARLTRAHQAGPGLSSRGEEPSDPPPHDLDATDAGSP